MTESSSSLASLDATAMRGMLASGEVSAVELLDAHLDLLAGAGAELNAVVDTDFEGARAAARAIDERRHRGDVLGALAGVPMTVKDSFDVAGMRTSHGRLSDSHQATSDAPTIARTRAADAVIYGKTNVPVLLADYQSSNPDFGRTLNPWAHDRTPGGSSGGSSAAIASGLAALELGSDLAGSIRMPAAWTGIFGHRPSNGIVSKMGHLPWETDGLMEPSVSVAGPMTRSARDLSLAMTVMQGAARLESVAWRVQLPEPRVTRLAGARVGLWLDDEAAPVENEMREALIALATALREAGCTVDELTSPPGSGHAGIELFDRMQAAEISHSTGDADFAAAIELSGDRDAPGSAWARALTQPMRTAWHDLEQQRRITTAWRDSVFNRFDVVLAPAVPGAAPLFDARPTSERTLTINGADYAAFEVVSTWSRLVNLAMLPSTVIPIGLGSETGLPLGAQLIGPYLEDRTPLTFAELLEADQLIVYRAPEGW